MGIETDTDKYKIGDGTTAWSSLSYSSLPSGTMTTSGGTFTGPVTFDGASPIVLEGATADAYETTIAVTDPTADRTITLPDATGTVAMSADVLPVSGGTMTGDIAMADNLVTRPVLKDIGETVSTNATSGAAATIDLANGNIHDLTLTANCTLTFSNPPASGTSGTFTLFLNQDATGSRTVTWPASVKWAGGTAPTLTTTASRSDILVFTTIDAGTIWYGAVSGQDYS
jgi:hypothetical protein